MVDLVGFFGPIYIKGVISEALGIFLSRLLKWPRWERYLLFSLTFVMLVVVDFSHVIVNFSALGGRDVSGGVLAFVDELFKEGVDLAVKGLSVKCALHSYTFVSVCI